MRDRYIEESCPFVRVDCLDIGPLPMVSLRAGRSSWVTCVLREITGVPRSYIWLGVVAERRVPRSYTTHAHSARDGHQRHPLQLRFSFLDTFD